MSQAKNFIGSIFMVAGCATGAGCLAIPMLAAGPSFIFSSLFVVVVGIFSYLLAIISLEIFITYKNSANVSTIVNTSFGRGGVIISGVINCVLMYGLLSIYMTGGADVLNKTIFPLIGLKVANQVSLIILLVIFLPLFFKGIELVVKSNKVIFYVKLISFLVAIIFGLGFFSTNLLHISLNQIPYILKALPIFLGALWFHFSIPVIAKINDYNRVQCKKVFFIGLLIPVVLYILWIGIMLSLVPRDGLDNSFFYLLKNKESVGAVLNHAIHNNPKLPIIMKFSLTLFSNVALLTSFLVVGVSTYDYIRDTLKIKQNKLGMIATLAITMMPPAFFALFFPNGFVFILQQVVILLLMTNIFVLLCCLREYDTLEVKPNKKLIWLILLGVIFLICIQLLDDFNLLPSFGIIT